MLCPANYWQEDFFGGAFNFRKGGLGLVVSVVVKHGLGFVPGYKLKLSSVHKVCHVSGKKMPPAVEGNFVPFGNMQSF